MPGRRNASKCQKASRSTKAVTRSDLHGGKMQVPENPPEITYQPWSPLVCADQFSNKETWTVHSLTKQIHKQLDPNGHAFKEIADDNKESEFRILFKIQSIRAWALNGKMIALSVEDFLVPNKDVSAVDQLCGIVDVGNANHIPALGYKLPIAHQNCVHRDTKTADQTLFTIVCDGAAIVYVNLLWRCDGPSALPQFQKGIEALVREMRSYSFQSNRNIRKIATDSGELLKKMDTLISKQPSILDEVVNEIPIGAAAVSVLAADDLREFFKDLKVLRRELGDTSSYDHLDDSDLV